MLLMIDNDDTLFRGINVDDLERPWTPRTAGFNAFWKTFNYGSHFKGELRRNGWRQTKTTCEQKLL